MISGVVALTLSPVMSSKLLGAGDEEHGLTGKINHTFDRIRDSSTVASGWDPLGIGRRFISFGSCLRALRFRCS